MEATFNTELRGAVEHNCRSNNYFRWIEYDNFRNIEEIGRGGFSVVYKTSYETYGEVAIKIIKDSHKNKKLFLNEFTKMHNGFQHHSSDAISLISLA
ncbi:24543_t:CDS:2 [Cetraspora pellucida]|uniref:24543_t:CDS:1 n=1 Tax=Cetraspora pellucida TaxID=1433469 RepID=A0A9N8ZLK9_9GLOM|nr:24543_t:CDS:2 [Cetraspora pellucida]